MYNTFGSEIKQGVATMTTRAEHMRECKERALEYVARGDTENAKLSFLSDITKHPETCQQAGVSLMLFMTQGDTLNDPAAMKKFIEGFN